MGLLPIPLRRLHVQVYELPADGRFNPAVERALREPRLDGYEQGGQVFIAVMFYSDGGVLLYWIKPRIQFLAAGRNLVMEPLVSGEARGYTKVYSTTNGSSVTSWGALAKCFMASWYLMRIKPSKDRAVMRLQLQSRYETLDVFEPSLTSRSLADGRPPLDQVNLAAHCSRYRWRRRIRRIILRRIRLLLSQLRDRIEVLQEPSHNLAALAHSPLAHQEGQTRPVTTPAPAASIPSNEDNVADDSAVSEERKQSWRDEIDVSWGRANRRWSLYRHV
ncbi:hypothetical protein DFH07DRAFT_948107 [Mycena maculata]|uniref:Uncharacterized protein n=1 Tax=Mycena maculata TaxID=230809 RepID=A0AAD7P2A3_9AGAR|nr:hypothetical protein DFH07DRAFT_948107 [Mycena maculata]